MNIVLVTPNEPFFLSENIERLIKKIDGKHKIISCVLLSPSPYGKRKNFLQKSLKVFQIFGAKFFLFYSFQYLKNLIFSKSVKKILINNNIKIIKLKTSINSKKSLLKLKSLNADIIVSILGNEIFKSQILNLYEFGCINLHSSLLPMYRGVMPSFWVLKNGETETGVSVFFMDEGIDSGKIITQQKIPISKNETQFSLIQKSKNIGINNIVKSLNLIESKKYKLIHNNVVEGSYYTFPTRKDVLDFIESGKKFF